MAESKLVLWYDGEANGCMFLNAVSLSQTAIPLISSTERTANELLYTESPRISGTAFVKVTSSDLTPRGDLSSDDP
jgi:hypothetical protein